MDDQITVFVTPLIGRTFGVRMMLERFQIWLREFRETGILIQNNSAGVFVTPWHAVAEIAIYNEKSRGNLPS